MSERPTFNLLDEPWIPVTLTSGESTELSMVDVLQRAREITAVNGDLPIQRFALIRLLLAAMYAAIPGGPANRAQPEYVEKHGPNAPFSKVWSFLWNNGIHDRVIEHLRRHHDRFDLLDPEQPFFQVADLHTAKGEASGLEKLVLDVPNGDPFFTTRIGEGLDSLSFAEAARWLVTVQAFDPSGIKTGVVGDPRVKGGRGYPIGVAWTGQLGGLLITGKTLAQTLALNFVGQGGQSATWNVKDQKPAGDRPAWERPQTTAAVTPGLDQTLDKAAKIDQTGEIRYFHGPATLYTWQSRRIRLFHDSGRVTGVIIANGDRLKPQNGQKYEPMTVWRRSPTQERSLGMPLVYMPLQHSAERSLWRGVANLLPVDNAEQQPDRLPSLASQWLSSLYSTGALSRDELVTVQAFGLVYGSNDSVVAEQIDDSLDLHLSVLASTDVALRGLLENATALADEGVKQVRSLAGNLASAAGLDPAAARVRAGERGYSSIDGLFRQWLAELTVQTDRVQALAAWRATARDAMLQLGSALVDECGPQTWTGREVKIGSSLRFVNAAVADLRFRTGMKKYLGAPDTTVATPLAKEIA
ncbi:type I-E CRISPR-associated protein Cse1/CasA [Pseudoclavibacter sp. 13-3]|uniref:type I-E CRISPR-associated protein Cse1/CasA n=1 Tax=Pseudoclavibacter sp. 13-3 TaxID=2901228 RepID=UPI001E52A9DE|nr:type I-E CRISPR-associated protein Cse1/CasA [Pseudoclavibacter sp. 13-3]MCD7100743.1 type I-E CRISPR-associated protein Cse1/CasA [Pseudoclavibacter sp. 13-3]